MAAVSAASMAALNTSFAGKKIAAAKKVSARVTTRALKPVRAAVAAPADVSSRTVNDCVNTVRFLAIDAINKSNSGHPGLPMGCAPMGYVIYREAMTHNPKNHTWFNRDRFVLSAGHGCMLQYSLMHLTGYPSVSVRVFSHPVVLERERGGVARRSAAFREPIAIGVFIHYEARGKGLSGRRRDAIRRVRSRCRIDVARGRDARCRIARRTDLARSRRLGVAARARRRVARCATSARESAASSRARRITGDLLFAFFTSRTRPTPSRFLSPNHRTTTSRTSANGIP